MSAPHDDEQVDLAHAVALAGLSGMGPATLARMLPPEASAVEIWSTLASAPPQRRREWIRETRRRDPVAEWVRARADGCRAARLGAPGYPRALVDDHEAPAIAFWSAASGLVADDLAGPAVAIIGTRRCTRAGRDLARELGRDLAELGVTVVSGLAAGIDAAAHDGVLAATCGPGPLAVVGSGLDVVYPRRNEALWRRVERHGLVVSEAPPGAAPEAWRFPARNRIIAALADVVVVVESHERGGSLLTATDAERRGREVMAVPGPVRSPASAGSNALLRDGAHPALGIDDVLCALSLARPDFVPASAGRARRGPAPEPTTDDLVTSLEDPERRVLEAVGWEPSSLDDVVNRTGLPLGAVAGSLARLEVAGLLESRDGWYERGGHAP